MHLFSYSSISNDFLLHASFSCQPFWRRWLFFFFFWKLKEGKINFIVLHLPFFFNLLSSWFLIRYYFDFFLNHIFICFVIGNKKELKSSTTAKYCVRNSLFVKQKVIKTKGNYRVTSVRHPNLQKYAYFYFLVGALVSECKCLILLVARCFSKYLTYSLFSITKNVFMLCFRREIRNTWPVTELQSLLINFADSFRSLEDFIL